jgi:hypothetical protein
MKKAGCILGIFCVLMLLYSCGDKNFDKNLLSGKWQQGTLFEKYFSDGTGYTWDVGDDVKEEEAQKFEWTLEKNDLTQIHLGEMGQKVPKSYTVTELTSSSLKYKDNYGKSYSFTKAD